MKKFAFGILSVFILLGGLFLTACGESVSLSVSTQEVVIYTNDSQEENYQSKEIEVAVEHSKLGIDAEILDGQDCIDIEKTNTSTKKANGKYGFILKTKENKNSGTARVRVWSVQDESKSKVINVTVNTILEHLIASSNDSQNNRTDLYVVKGVEKNLAPEEFFDFSPITANVDDLVWTFDATGTQSFSVDGQERAVIDGSTLLVFDSFSMEEVVLRATFTRNTTISESITLKVIEASTIKDFIVEDKEFYKNGVSHISGATIELKRNDSNSSRAYGSATINTSYAMDFDLVVRDQSTNKLLSKEEYEKYFVFDITGSNSTTYTFYIDALDTTDERVFGNFVLQFKFSYRNYNFDLIPSDINLRLNINYTATRVDIYNDNKNIINNSSIDVFSSYVSAYGYKLQPIVQPETITIDNNMFQIAIDTNQASIRDRLSTTNPIDSLAKFYYHGTYLRFRQESNASPVFVSENIVSGSEVYVTAVGTFENVCVSVRSAANNTIKSDVYVYFYQITSDDDLTISVSTNGEEVVGDTYLSSSVSAERKITFEAQIDGISTIAGLSLKSGKKVDGAYVENPKFEFSNLEVLESNNSNDDKFVKVRFVASLTDYNFTDETSFWFEHVTNKMSDRYSIKAFVPISAASVLSTEASSDIYINRNAVQGFAAQAESLIVDAGRVNSSVSKLMVEAGATVMLSTDYRNATLNDAGISYKYLSYEDLLAVPDLDSLGIDPEELFANADLEKLAQVYRYFDEVNTAVININKTKLIVGDIAFKGFVCVLFGGYDENHEELTLARLFTIESFYSIRYLSSNTKTKLLYTAETLSETDMSRSYVDVTIEMRPDAKVPTYSNILDKLSFASLNTTLEGNNALGFENDFYKISAIGFANNGRYIKFRVTAYSTNLQTYLKDSLVVAYEDGNSRIKTAEIQLEIRNVKRIENVEWVNQTYSNEIYLNLTSYYDRDKNFTISTSVLPSDANDVGLTYQYHAVSGAATDLDVAVNAVGQTFNVNISTSVGGYGYLYLLPNDMIKVVEGSRKVLLYNYVENEYGQIVDEIANYSVDLTELNTRYEDIINGASGISPFFLNNEGKKIFYKDIILKIYVVIADGKSSETAIRIYSQGDLEKIDTALYYKLMNDINLVGWEGLSEFGGEIDGQGYTLNFGENCNGLINSLSGKLKNINITGTINGGTNVYAGALASVVSERGIIDGCSVDVLYNSSTNVYAGAKLVANSSVTNYVGWIAGRNDGKILNTYIYGASIESNADYAGGIVGLNNGKISASGYEFYKAAVGEQQNRVEVSGKFGGFVGKAGSTSVIEKTYVYTFVDESVIDAETSKAFAGVAANNAVFTECFAYLFDVDSLYDKEGTGVVNVSNCYVSYDNAGSINVKVFVSNGTSTILTSPTQSTSTIITGDALNFWQTGDQIDNDVNFGFVHLKNVAENAKVDPAALDLNDTKNSLTTDEAKKGILVVYKPTISIVNNVEKTELDLYNTISIQDLFSLAGERLSERQARSLLLSSLNKNITFTSSNVKILNATQAEFEVIVRSKMDATLTSTFTFIVVNKVPKLVTMVDGYQLTDDQIIMLQTTKTKNIIYSTSSTIALNGNVYNLEKDNYQIEDIVGDENVYASKNSNIVVLNGLMAHVGNNYTTLLTKMSVSGLNDAYKNVLTLNRTINASVYNGATSFVVRNASGLVVKASQAAPFEIYMTSDDENDNLTLSLGYGQIIIEDSTNSDSEANFDVDGKLSLNVVWSKTLIGEKQYKFAVTIRIDVAKLHLVDEIYDNLTLYVKPTSQADNDTYTKQIDFVVDTQSVDDVSILPYRIDGRVVKRSTLYLTRGNEILTTLTPSSDAIVAVIVDPAYSQMSHFVLTYSAIGTGSLGTISITKLAYNADYGYYTNVTNSTIITNGIRVNITDADKQAQGVYYFRIYASSSFSGEATIQFNATFFNGSEQLRSAQRSITISSLQEAEVKVNGASTYLLAKGESAVVSVKVAPNQSVHNLYLQNSGANILLGDMTSTNYGSYVEYTATLYAGVDATLNNGDESGVFYVCASVERIVNGVQEIKVSRATICLVDFGIDTSATRVGNSNNRKLYNGKEYDTIYAYVNSESELYFDYKLLPEEYVYDKTDSAAQEKVAEMIRKRNLFLDNYCYMDDNAGYYINCVYNENRGIYEELTIQEQLWYANDESHYSSAYNKNYDEFVQNDYFNLSLTNRGNLMLSGKRTGNQLMMLRTRVAYQGIEFVRDYFFLVVIEVWTDEDAPLTISSAEEFIDKATKGNTAADYVLTNDIVLKDYNPVNTDLFDSFDGNGYTIHIESFALPVDSNTLRLALFDTIAQNTTIKNVKVNIYNGGQIVVNIDKYRTVYVAGFAITNNGIIYNSEVVSYYDNEYQTSRVSGDAGIVVKYTKGAGMDAVELTSLMDVESHVSGFVCENSADASIVNGRVGGDNLSHFTTLNGSVYLEHINLGTFVLTGQGEVSGFAGQNDGYISASFAKKMQINNEMNSNASSTAGFVLSNTRSIQNSYVEGVGGNLDENGDLDPAFKLSNIKAKGIVAGFVHTNSGLVKNAYSNIKIESTSYASAGFVYQNQKDGTISICYSASAVSDERIGQMQFSGVNAFEESLNDGIFELCYYYDSARTDETNEAKLGTGAIAITDVFDVETFYGYSFASSEGAYNGVWEMTTMGASIVSANQIALSNRYVRTIGTTAQTTVIYNTSVRDLVTYELYEISYGSLHNPIIIRNAEEFAKATGKAADKEISSYKNWYTDTEVKGNYRIVFNLDMSEIGQEDDDLKAVRLCTTTKTFSGILDGNGFTISNVSLGSQVRKESFGLFARLNGAVIMNLDILVSSVHDSDANVVGTLAGVAVDSRILAINLAPVSGPDEGAAHTAVQGNNIVGGVVGMLMGDSYMSDITVSSVDVESVYYLETKQIGANKQYTQFLRESLDAGFREKVEKLSYAGGVVGYVDIYKKYNDAYMKYDAYKTTEFNVVSIKVRDSVDIFAEIAGGLFGYTGPNTMVYDASIILDADMSKSNPSYIIAKNLFAGGIVGENYGALHAVYARYVDELQTRIEENENNYYRGAGFAGAERGQQTIFQLRSGDRGYTERVSKPMFIGGIAGYMGGGYIYVGYNKLNVISYSENTKAAGGIVGLLGKTSNSYTISFLTKAKTANYLFYDVYASGDVYTIGYKHETAGEIDEISGVSGGIIGQIAGRENAGEDMQTPSIVMKDVVALNYFSVDSTTKKLSGERFEEDFDQTTKTYTSTNHFTLIGGVYDARAKKDTEAAINADICLISNYNDVYTNVYDGSTDGSTAGTTTVGGYNTIKLGDYTINLNFFGFGIAVASQGKILTSDHIGLPELSEMSYAYSRMYAYFIANGWEEKYWNHKQNTLYPEIELLPKLSIMFWDWYNTDEVLQKMNSTTTTIVVRGQTKAKDGEIKDIDLRAGSALWESHPEWSSILNEAEQNGYFVKTFRGRLYSYQKYMNSMDGGMITSEIRDGENQLVGGEANECAGIIVDRQLFDSVEGSVVIDGVSFYFDGDSTTEHVDYVTYNFAHTIEESIVRNSKFVLNDNLSLTTKTEKVEDGGQICGSGVISDVARSTSFINDQVLFRKINKQNDDEWVDIYFNVKSNGSALKQNHYVGLFVGLMQQDSQFANITLQNCTFDQYGRDPESETNVEIRYHINDTSTDQLVSVSAGVYAGKAARQTGAKFGADMVQFYQKLNIEYINEYNHNVFAGGYFGEVKGLNSIQYVVPEKKPQETKSINIDIDKPGAVNVGTFIGAISGMSGAISGTAATEVRGSIKVASGSEALSVGGLIGDVNQCSTFSISGIRLSVDLDVQAQGNNATLYVGGIAGKVQASGMTIANCNAIKNNTDGVVLSNSAQKDIYSGGMIGYTEDSSLTIATTQNNALNELNFDIKQAREAYIGGLVGQMKASTTRKALSVGESGTYLRYTGDVLVNDAETSAVEGPKVGKLMFGGVAGLISENVDAVIKQFVYGGKVETRMSTDQNVIVGGIVGIVKTDSATINNNLSYGDVFVNYKEDASQLASYSFGGIVAEIDIESSEMTDAIEVKNNYAMMTNFNSRTTYKVSGAQPYYVGALVGKNAEVAEKSNNLYSSGVCLAYQEEAGADDIPYTSQDKYYGYLRETKITEDNSHETGIVSMIVGFVSDTLLELNNGTKLSPIKYDGINTTEIDGENSHGITWVSVVADVTTSQQLVEGNDVLKNTAFVGNGRTITRSTNNSIGQNFEAGFIGQLGAPFEANAVNEGHQFVSNLIFNLNLEENATTTYYGGVVGKMAGNSTLYAVGVTGTLSVGGTENVQLGGLVGSLNGGFIDNCFVDLDITYRAGQDGNTSGVANISSGFSTIAETYTLGMITAYSSADTIGSQPITNVFKLASIDSRSPQENGKYISLYDNYSLMQYDASKLVVGDAAVLSYKSGLDTGKSLNYENNNSTGFEEKVVPFGELKSYTIVGSGEEDDQTKVIVGLKHNWKMEERVNYGYATQPFGFIRAAQIQLYTRTTPAVVGNEVHKNTYTYTRVGLAGLADVNVKPASTTDAAVYFGVLNIDKFNEMLVQASSAAEQNPAYKYVLRYDIDGGRINNKLHNAFISVNDANFELEAGGHTIKDYSKEQGLFNSLAGTIENLRMTNARITPNGSVTQVGIVANVLKSGSTLKSVTIEGSITNTKATIVGGVVGKMEGGELALIESVANIDSSANEGIVGGVVGEMANGEIAYASSNGILSNTATNGDVGLNVNVRSRGDNSGANYNASESLASITGGIVGHQNAGAISNAYNTNSVLGNFTGDSNVSAVAGGIVGYHVGGTIDCSYNAGFVGAGNYSVTSKISVAGGIFGYSTAASGVTNCMNDGAVQALSKVVATNQTIEIHLTNGKADQSLTAEPENLIFNVKSVYNSLTNFREVYAYGIGYSAASSVANSNKTSTDNIKNDGNIGKYEQNNEQAIVFNRKDILGNNLLETGDVKFYAAYKLQSGFTESKTSSGEEEYDYGISGVDSYGFTNRIYMVDEITRQYGRIYYDTDIYQTYNNFMVSADDWYYKGRLYSYIASGSSEYNYTYKYKSSNWSPSGWLNPGSPISDTIPDLYKNNNVLNMIGAPVKYASSTILGKTYDEILAELNEIGVLNGADELEKEEDVSSIIKEINGHFDNLDDAEVTNVVGDALLVAKTGNQLRTAIAPNAYDISAEFILPNSRVPRVMLEGNHQFTDAPVISDYSDEGGQYKRRVTYTAYFAEGEIPTNMQIIATYQNTFRISLSKSNVDNSGAKTKICLEDENGATNVDNNLINDILSAEANGQKYIEGEGSSRETEYNGYKVYIVDDLVEDVSTLSGEVSCSLNYSDVTDRVYVTLNGNKVTDWTNKNYLYIVADVKVTTREIGLEISVSKDTSNSGTQNIDFSWTAEKMINAPATSKPYEQVSLSAYGYLYNQTTRQVDMKAVASAISANYDTFVAGFIFNGVNRYGIKGKNGGTWSWSLNNSPEINISASGIITYDSSVQESDDKFFTNWTAYYNTNNVISGSGFPETISQDFGLFTAEVTRDTSRADGGLGSENVIEDLNDPNAETILNVRFYRKVSSAEITHGTTKIKAKSAGVGYLLSTGSTIKNGASSAANEVIYEGTYNKNQTFSIECMKTIVDMGEANSFSENGVEFVLEQDSNNNITTILEVTNDIIGTEYTESVSQVGVNIVGMSAVSTIYTHFYGQNLTNYKVYGYKILANGDVLVSFSNVQGQNETGDTYVYLYHAGKIYTIEVQSTSQSIDGESSEVWTSSKYTYVADATLTNFSNYMLRNASINLLVDYIAGAYSSQALSFIKFASASALTSQDGVSENVDSGYENIGSVKIYGNVSTLNVNDIDTAIQPHTVKFLDTTQAEYNISTGYLTAKQYNPTPVEFDAGCKQTKLVWDPERIPSEENIFGSVQYIAVGSDLYLESALSENGKGIVGANHVIKFVSQDNNTELFKNNCGTLKDMIVVGVASGRSASGEISLFVNNNKNEGLISGIRIYGGLRNVQYHAKAGKEISVYPVSKSANLHDIQSYVSVNVLDADGSMGINVSTTINNLRVVNDETMFVADNILVSGDGYNGENRQDVAGKKDDGSNGGNGGSISGENAKFIRTGIGGIGGFGSNGTNGKIKKKVKPIGISLSVDNSGIAAHNCGSEGDNGKYIHGNTAQPIHARSVCLQQKASVKGIKAFGIISSNQYVTSNGQTGIWKNNYNKPNNSNKKLVIFGPLAKSISPSNTGFGQWYEEDLGWFFVPWNWFNFVFNAKVDEWEDNISKHINDKLKTASLYTKYNISTIYHIRDESRLDNGTFALGSYKGNASCVYANYAESFNKLASFNE